MLPSPASSREDSFKSTSVFRHRATHSRHHIGNWSMATYKSDKPYEGSENILIGFDIGTTQSAVSFSYVSPCGYPEVHTVVKWPGQPESGGEAKIPTIIAYRDGKAYACGAEAREYFYDENFEIASWFKLHLHPQSMKVSDLPPAYGSPANEKPEIEIPPLPRHTTLTQVYSDFIDYLYKRTKIFFIETSPNGKGIWNRLENGILIVFCIPNGWGIYQQNIIRDAAIRAGIVNAENSVQRIKFVTESEASVHYAIAHTSNMDWLKERKLFAIIDAGGSTIDSTLYECKSSQPLQLEEVCTGDCIQAGGIFVDRAVRRMLENKLRRSLFSGDEYLKEMVDAFERKTKRSFDGTQSLNTVDFGRTRDNDSSHGIIKGRLGLTTVELSGVFEDTVRRTIDSLLNLLRGRKVQHVLLVGGFGGSPFLRKRLSDLLATHTAEIVSVEEYSKKAAAEGALVWYIKQLVASRVLKYTFGAEMGVDYNPRDELHRSRADLTYKNAQDTRRVRVFGVWAQKDTRVTRNWSTTFEYRPTWDRYPRHDYIYSIPVYIHEQNSTPPWVYDKSGQLLQGYKRVCTLKAQLREMIPAIQKANGNKGSYWYLDLEAVIQFDGTQLRGKLQWKDKQGKCKEGPMSILAGIV
ncbi:hypothetical protein CPB86DRAFT_476431 [Serendipita vermifera]|nr:hypothetical protein CPB86DRAFT_476431 [Serendipita vermifera]